MRNDLRINDTPFPANLTAQRDRVPDETRGTNMELHYKWGEGIPLSGRVRFQGPMGALGGSVRHRRPARAIFHRFHARRQEYAGYLEQEGRLFNGMMLLTGGVRVDGNSEFGIEVSPSWTVAIPLERWGLTLRGSYSEGFRAPSFNELFFPDFGNPKLNPELSSEYDGGITKTFGETASFTATYFSRRVHSLIVAEPCTTFPGCVEAANAGRVDTQGVELVPAVQLMRGLAFSGNLTVIDETHVSSSPEIRPLRVPKYAAFALLTYAHKSLWKIGRRGFGQPRLLLRRRSRRHRPDYRDDSEQCRLQSVRPDDGLRRGDSLADGFAAKRFTCGCRTCSTATTTR